MSDISGFLLRSTGLSLLASSSTKLHLLASSFAFTPSSPIVSDPFPSESSSFPLTFFSKLPLLVSLVLQSFIQHLLQQEGSLTSRLGYQYKAGLAVEVGQKAVQLSKAGRH